MSTGASASKGPSLRAMSREEKYAEEVLALHEAYQVGNITLSNHLVNQRAHIYSGFCQVSKGR